MSNTKLEVFVWRDFFKAFLYLQWWFPLFIVLSGTAVWIIPATDPFSTFAKWLYIIFVVLAEGFTFVRSVRIATDSRKDGTMWERINTMRWEEDEHDSYRDSF